MFSSTSETSISGGVRAAIVASPIGDCDGLHPDELLDAAEVPQRIGKARTDEQDTHRTSSKLSRIDSRRATAGVPASPSAETGRRIPSERNAKRPPTHNSTGRTRLGTMGLWSNIRRPPRDPGDASWRRVLTVLTRGPRRDGWRRAEPGRRTACGELPPPCPMQTALVLRVRRDEDDRDVTAQGDGAGRAAGVPTSPACGCPGRGSPARGGRGRVQEALAGE